MAKPIWSGAISFGLLHIPIQVMPAEKRIDLHFRLLDHRDDAPIRYERVNAETGEEVPWKNVVKAFEYEKGSYVVVEKEDFVNAAPQSAESVDIEAFIDAAEVSALYYEKPYYLVPLKKAEKGYVLLRETLKEQHKVGLSRVVIRTREYLALVAPLEEALVLYLIRYPQELLPTDSYSFPDRPVSSYRISKKELDMASQLVTSMAGRFEPDSYSDEFRDKLAKSIEARLKQQRGRGRRKGKPRSLSTPETSGKVIDFMSLLQKSIKANERTPAARPAGRHRKSPRGRRK